MRNTEDADASIQCMRGHEWFDEYEMSLMRYGDTIKSKTYYFSILVLDVTIAKI